MSLFPYPTPFLPFSTPTPPRVRTMCGLRPGREMEPPRSEAAGGRAAGGRGTRGGAGLEEVGPTHQAELERPVLVSPLSQAPP